MQKEVIVALYTETDRDLAVCRDPGVNLSTEVFAALNRTWCMGRVLVRSGIGLGV